VSNSLRLQLRVFNSSMGFLLLISSVFVAYSASSSASVSESLPSLTTLQSYIASSVEIVKAPPSSSTYPPYASLSFAQTIWPATYSSPCYVTTPKKVAPVSPLRSCSYGDKSARRVILLTGDSQAGGWLAAFNAFGLAHHWRIVFLAMAKCAPWGSGASGDATLYNEVKAKDCDNFRASVLDSARRIHPSATVLVGLGYFGPLSILIGQELATAKKYASTKAKVLFLRPVPQYEPWIRSPSPVSCLLLHSLNISECFRSPEVLINQEYVQVFKYVASQVGGSVINTTPLFCTKSKCALYVFDGVKRRMINSDATHMNYFYAGWISRAFGEILEPSLLNLPR